MRIWFNRINESQRSCVEVSAEEVTIGRSAGNALCLPSPLVSARHAVVRARADHLELLNLGSNTCHVQGVAVANGRAISFPPGAAVRIWPYTLTFEVDSVAPLRPEEVERHLRALMADLELRIHRRLLERLDPMEMLSAGQPSRENILLLERNIEDLCTELKLFSDSNNSVLDSVLNLLVCELLINQVILEDNSAASQFAGTLNDFDIPASLIPERETELQSLCQFLRERMELHVARDLSEQILRIETALPGALAEAQPRIHQQLRNYVVLRALKKDLKDIVFGFGPIQDLLRAPAITEIMVASSDQIYVERDGLVEKSGRRFISDQVTESIIERIVAQVGRRIDKSQPLVDARLPDGSRVNAVIPPLATRGPCLTIRRFPAKRLTIDDLVQRESITIAAANFLGAAVLNRRNILISGGTGAGKTTVLNVLSSFIPAKDRIVTIEDTTELQLHQEHVISLETKAANVEGQGAYTTRDLVRNALRMRPDRLIVGECRGPEVLDMLQAMNSGHDGSLTTLHANAAEEVIERLELLVLMVATLPVTAIHRQISSALDLIVHISRLPSGQRVVTQIAEVTRTEDERISVADIYNYRDGRSLKPTGYLPSFMTELVEKGFLDLETLFGHGTEPVPAVGHESTSDAASKSRRQVNHARAHPIGQ